MLFSVLVHALFAMKHQEEHAERIKCGNKYPGNYRVVSKLMTGNGGVMHRFNNAVFGEET